MIRKWDGLDDRDSQSGGWFEMHAVVSGKRDVARSQVSLGEVSGEGFRKLMSAGVRYENSLGERPASIGQHQGHSFFHRPLATTRPT